MAVRKRKTAGRMAPRYRFNDGDRQVIRFTSSRHRRIATTRIFDISETGISFTCHFRVAPKIGEVIMMDFAPLGAVQMAVMGRVVRLEEPTKAASWARFPGTVKIGVSFHKMPRVYVKVINRALKDAFERGQMKKSEAPLQIDQKPETRDTWWTDNAWTFVVAFAILLVVGMVAYIIVDTMDEGRVPASQAPWAENFFNKVIEKPNK